MIQCVKIFRGNIDRSYVAEFWHSKITIVDITLYYLPTILGHTITLSLPHLLEYFVLQPLSLDPPPSLFFSLARLLRLIPLF